MSEKFSMQQFEDAAKNAVAFAQSLADVRKNPEMTGLHIAWGALAQNGSKGLSVKEQVLLSASLDLLLDKLPRNGTGTSFMQSRLLELCNRLSADAKRRSGKVSLHSLLSELASTPELDSVSLSAWLNTLNIETKALLSPWPEEPSVELHPSRRPVVGLLAVIVSRPQDAVAILVGEPGSGRTTVLRALIQGVRQGALGPAMPKLTFRTLSLSALEQQRMESSEPLYRSLSPVLNEMRDDEVLVLDGLEVVSRGGAFGIPGLDKELLHALRPMLVERSLRAILTMTPGVYKALLASDPPWSTRAQRVDLDPMPTPVLRDLLMRAVEQSKTQRNLTQEAAELILHAAGTPEGLHPPASMLRLFQDAVQASLLRRRDRVIADDVLVINPKIASGKEVDRETLASLEGKLQREVIAQDEAIRAVCARLRVAKMQLDRRVNRPDGVFLLVGPSGVGKTELARAVAKNLYGDLSRLIRLDMSEYAEEHQNSRLIGSPTGYIGSTEGGWLVQKARSIGHGVLLLDELEKAHPRILNTFLQVFDAGVLTDGRGESADFSRFVIFMTSNLGRELWATERKGMGFGTSNAETAKSPEAEDTREHLLKVLPSEFLGRIDAVIPFRALQRNDLANIAQQLLADEISTWQRRNKQLIVEDDVREWLVNHNYQPQFGARHLIRNIEQHIVQKIADSLFSDAFLHTNTMRAVLQEEQVIIKPGD